MVSSDSFGFESKLIEFKVGARLEGVPWACDFRDRKRFVGVFAIVFKCFDLDITATVWVILCVYVVHDEAGHQLRF